MVFLYLVTTGWIFDISLCDNSINQSRYSIGEKPAIILYTFIDRHGGTLDQRQKHTMDLGKSQLCYIRSLDRVQVLVDRSRGVKLI